MSFLFESPTVPGTSQVLGIEKDECLFTDNSMQYLEANYKLSISKLFKQFICSTLSVFSFLNFQKVSNGKPMYRYQK